MRVFVVHELPSTDMEYDPVITNDGYQIGTALNEGAIYLHYYDDNTIIRVISPGISYGNFKSVLETSKLAEIKSWLRYE